MTHLIAAENWPAANIPKQLAYFCGVMSDAAAIPGSRDTTFPTAEKERPRVAACEYLTKNASYLWPKAIHQETGEFDWNILVSDDDTGTGQIRFAAQYWRPNINPSERYTLAVAGSTKYRLRADQSGFKNLVLACDWVRNGLNTPGCIESAVISGRQAERAIHGAKRPIIGETDFPPEASLWLRILRCILRLVQILLRATTMFHKEKRQWRITGIHD
jgi:uncharacterized protein with NAD-binding domain and iron-sulfur cluster